MNLNEKINEIGDKLVVCKLCGKKDHVENSEFIPPRCLYLDPKESKELSCVVVGINPGQLKAGSREYEAYKASKNTSKYKAQVDYFENNKGVIRYSKRIDELLKSMGLKENGKGVLWTELCKCQLSDDFQGLPFQTFRRCAGKYLTRELDASGDVPVVAVGNQTYTILSFFYPKRAVIGVLHPTGTHVSYDSYIEKVRKLRPLIKDTISKKECLWLPYS